MYVLADLLVSDYGRQDAMNIMMEIGVKPFAVRFSPLVRGPTQMASLINMYDWSMWIISHGFSSWGVPKSQAPYTTFFADASDIEDQVRTISSLGLDQNHIQKEEVVAKGMYVLRADVRLKSDWLAKAVSQTEHAMFPFKVWSDGGPSDVAFYLPAKVLWAFRRSLDGHAITAKQQIDLHWLHTSKLLGPVLGYCCDVVADANTEKEWNPLYQIVGRPEKPRNPHKAEKWNNTAPYLSTKDSYQRCIDAVPKGTTVIKAHPSDDTEDDAIYTQCMRWRIKAKKLLDSNNAAEGKFLNTWGWEQHYDVLHLGATGKKWTEDRPENKGVKATLQKCLEITVGHDDQDEYWNNDQIFYTPHKTLGIMNPLDDRSATGKQLFRLGVDPCIRCGTAHERFNYFYCECCRKPYCYGCGHYCPSCRAMYCNCCWDDARRKQTLIDDFEQMFRSRDLHSLHYDKDGKPVDHPEVTCWAKFNVRSKPRQSQLDIFAHQAEAIMHEPGQGDRHKCKVRSTRFIHEELRHPRFLTNAAQKELDEIRATMIRDQIRAGKNPAEGKSHKAETADDPATGSESDVPTSKEEAKSSQQQAPVLRASVSRDEIYKARKSYIEDQIKQTTALITEEARKGSQKDVSKFNELNKILEALLNDLKILNEDRQNQDMDS